MTKYVIDTSSLISIVRYYLPFDRDNSLYNFIKEKIEKSVFIVIDEVLEECKYVAKGVVIQRLDFLKDKVFLKKHRVPCKTDSLTPPNPKKFFRMLDNQFAVQSQKKRLNEAEFEEAKSNYLKKADIRQIMLCLNFLHNGEAVVMISEETTSPNDNKVFKKIPQLCKEAGIMFKTVSELITIFQEKGDIFFSVSK